MNTRLRQQLADPALQQRLIQLAADANGSTLLSLTLDLGPGTDDWLAQLPEQAPYWYRARPASGEFRLGIGHALHLSSDGAERFTALGNAYAGMTRDWRHAGHVLAFCGFSFAAHSGNSDLPSALLAVPAIALESSHGHCRAILTTTVARIDEAVSNWCQLIAQPMRAWALHLLPEADRTLAERAWLARVNAAQRAINLGHLEKLVLARKRQLQASTRVSTRHLLEMLSAHQPDACIYAFSQGSTTFLGATPERLVRLHERQIAADALAGTAWPGSIALEESKNRHEQSLVVRAIVAALAPLCQAAPSAHPVEIQHAGRVSHLRSRIEAKALSSTTLFDLLGALHPTPAVGGYPTAAALDWLQTHGEQRSGWYSGGIGILDGKGNGEFSVALRSALIQGRQIELQAGAGIVADSDPWQELAETDAKLSTLLDVLHGTQSTRQKIGS